MRVQINLKVFGVGYPDDIVYSTVDDTSDTIFLQFFANGEWHSFESEAYHLSAWCQEKGFTYYEHRETIWVEMVPWNPATK